MQQTFSQDAELCRLMAPVKPTFKIFIAGENQSAFFQTRRVQDQVEAWCGNKIEISRVFWNFVLLGHEELRQYAAKEAAVAEMIVISLRSGSELPPHVKCWVESWPDRAPAGQAALVTLIGPEEEIGRGDQQPSVAYLQRMAKMRGLEFFCNQDGWQRLEFSKPAVPRLAEGAMVREKSLGDVPWSRGGINE